MRFAITPLLLTVLLIGGLAGTSSPAERVEPTGDGHYRGQHRGLEQSRSAPAHLTWPLAGTPQLVRPYELPSHEYGPGHRGADLAGDLGQPVLAAGDGVVTFAGWLIDRNVVSVEHAGGLRTSYEPVAATVAVGQPVTAGHVLGTLEGGHPGCQNVTPRPCLHWGARHNHRYVDPVRLASGTVRLLPWGRDATR